MALATAVVVAGCVATAAQPAPSGLEGTRWQLAVMTSMDDAQPPLRPADPARYTIEFAADGALLVRLDCNSGRASWQATPAPGSGPERRSGSLTFGPLATTRAACAPGSLEPQLAKQLPYVRSFVIEKRQLHLALMADGGILSWNPAGSGPPR
jgi:heat shock protein HslJ